MTTAAQVSYGLRHGSVRTARAKLCAIHRSNHSVEWLWDSWPDSRASEFNRGGNLNLPLSLSLVQLKPSVLVEPPMRAGEREDANWMHNLKLEWRRVEREECGGGALPSSKLPLRPLRYVVKATPCKHAEVCGVVLVWAHVCVGVCARARGSSRVGVELVRVGTVSWGIGRGPRVDRNESRWMDGLVWSGLVVFVVFRFAFKVGRVLLELRWIKKERKSKWTANELVLVQIH